MAFKPMIKNEIELLDTPEEFRVAVEKELEDRQSALLKVVKTIQYPYIDKDREMIVYKAYIMSLNLAILISLIDNSSVSRDRMVIGDCNTFMDFWNSREDIYWSNIKKNS